MTVPFLLALVVGFAPSSTPHSSSLDGCEPLGADSYRIVSNGFGPVGTVRVKRPTFAWSVLPQDGAQVTASTIRINGKKVPGAYNVDHGEVAYTPAKALPAGDYKVQVQVEVAAKVNFRKEWTTTVPPDAIERLPAPDAHQREIFDALNSQRKAMGLDPFALDESLCAAAGSHATYLAENSAMGHEQSAAGKAFSGQMPWDRTRAYGFSGGTWEAAGYQISDPKLAFAAIFDAPYHRVPFLQPGTARVGVGFSSRGTVIDGEMPFGTGTTVSPGDGQTGVPTSWKGYERPDPLRHWPELQRPTGYPIVLADFGGTGKLEVSSGHLFLGDQEVKSYLVTPSMDEHITDAAFLIPERPLGRGKTYRVEVNARRDGRDLSRRWSFTTAS